MNSTTQAPPLAKDDFAESFRELTRTFSGNVVNPYPMFSQYREANPVKSGDLLSEFGVPSRAVIAGSDQKIFTVFRYEDAARILRDSKTFTSGFLANRPGLLGQGPTSLDGEEHRFMRTLYAQAFANRRSIERWQQEVIETAVEEDVLGPLRQRGRAELITDIALQFPVRIIYKIIGFPDSREQSDYFAAQALWALTILPGDSERARMSLARAQKAATELMDYALDAVRARRRAGGDEISLIGCLLAARAAEGSSLDDTQIAEFVCSLLPAAAETTTRSFANLIVLLFDHPEQFDLVRSDRTLVARAVTEAVRFEGPAAFLAREAATDVEIRGTLIPAGSTISLALGSANHDNDAFPDGDSFIISRKVRPSLGFGIGPHMCLGMQIAKLEMEALLNSLLDLPDFRLDEAAERPVIKGLHFRCSDSIPVLWN
jgi:cytochrome P450